MPDYIFSYLLILYKYSATIKIPLHKLRRDRLDKSPAQLAIEAELARKKEMDLPYEDCTEVSFLQQCLDPVRIDSLFFSIVSLSAISLVNTSTLLSVNWSYING